MVRAELAPLVAHIEAEREVQAPWLAAAARRLLDEEPSWPHGRFDYALDNPAMFPAPARLSIDEFWPRFFYAFVDPASRTGAGLNYAGRLAEAEARILPSSWVWLRIPPRTPAVDG
jgi:hypothetical protein